MVEAMEYDTLGQLLDPIRNCFTPEVAKRISDLRADPVVQSRLDTFAERHHEGQLSEEEQEEYFSMVRACNLIAVLQAKARSVLNESK